MFLRSTRRWKDGIVVRVIEYELENVEDAERVYRLITTLLESKEAPAEESRGPLSPALGNRRRA